MSRGESAVAADEEFDDEHHASPLASSGFMPAKQRLKLIDRRDGHLRKPFRTA